MEKPSLFLISLLPVILFSCIEIQVDLTLQSNTSGILSLDYRFSREMENLWELDPGQSPFVPRSRAHWDRETEIVPGTTLLSHSREQGALYDQVRVEVAFSTPGALEGLFVRWGQRLTLLGIGSQVQLNFQPRSMVGELDDQSRELAISMFGQNTVTLNLVAPAPIAQDNLFPQNQGQENSTWEFTLEEFWLGNQQEWILLW